MVPVKINEKVTLNPLKETLNILTELDPRVLNIFREIVEVYFTSGEPVSSRTISRRLGNKLSAATIRNIMSDLQEEGLIYSPHPSAGRIPTECGLRLFVNGILEVRGLSPDDQEVIENQCSTNNKRSISEVLEETSTLLADLTSCVGLVAVPKTDLPLKHIEFMHISRGRILAILVTKDGHVENRLIDIPFEVSSTTLEIARNYLNTRLNSRTLKELHHVVLKEIEDHKAELDILTTNLIEAGLTTCTEDMKTPHQLLIIRGQAKLLGNVTALKDVDRIRTLFEALETRDTMSQLLEAVHSAEGVQIFIGAENVWFRDAGCSLIVSSYHNKDAQIIGAVGVLGLQRLDYARIIPMVDYTAKVISRTLSS